MANTTSGEQLSAEIRKQSPAQHCGAADSAGTVAASGGQSLSHEVAYTQPKTTLNAAVFDHVVFDTAVSGSRWEPLLSLTESTPALLAHIYYPYSSSITCYPQDSNIDHYERIGALVPREQFARAALDISYAFLRRMCESPEGQRIFDRFRSECTQKLMGMATVTVGADQIVRSVSPVPNVAGNAQLQRPRRMKGTECVLAFGELPQSGFVRLKKVLEVYPRGRSSFFADLNMGRFPKGTLISKRTRCWDVDEVRDFLNKLQNE